MRVLLATTAVTAVTAALDPPSPPTGGFPDTGDECQPASEQPDWPTFHIVNNVTKHEDGHLTMEALNDANAVFHYGGLYHVMNQAGGGNWTHAISNDLIHWFHIADALGRGPKNSTWDNLGACDGTVSFPDLGKAPFDGSTPIMMYGPDCGVPLHPHKPPPPSAGRLGASSKTMDTPRVEVALPAEPGDDKYLTNWKKTQPGPVTFTGTPCSFPGRVWKSKVGDYWNMLCAYGGDPGPWARFTSSDPSLMTWQMADKSFTQGADRGCDAGALFHRLPGAPASGGPTHMINGPGSGEAFYLGTYDDQKEIFTVTSPLQVVDYGAYHWAASGNDGPDPDSDTGRLLTAAWIGVKRAPSVISLIRSMSYDAATQQLVTFPVAEYTGLRNATIVNGKHLGALAAGSSTLLPVPSTVGGAVDILASFELATGQSGFGISVRSGDVNVSVVSVRKLDGGGGGFNVTLSFFSHPVGQQPPPAPPAPPPTPVLAFMNHTDLGAGDYHTVHLPVGTDPKKCQELCLADKACAVWTYVIRGQPAGSGDCIFKSEQHMCPSPNPSCTSGRGHEPIGTKCLSKKPQPPTSSRATATIAVLPGETLDMRVIVDRPVVEIFINKGRAAFVSADGGFNTNRTEVSVFNRGTTPVMATNVSAFGMGCGWAKTKPVPKTLATTLSREE